jgi:outer membrane cobalamin receptor
MHRSRLRFLLFTAFPVLILIGLATPALAAGTITGRVVDQDGRPVPGATVFVTGEGVPLQSATTGENGRFEIASPGVGQLTLRVAMDGFRADAISFDGGSDTRDVGTVALFVSAVSESVVVSAAQVEVPLTQVTSSVTVISGAELESRQVHTVSDALRTVPGLTVVSTGGIGANTNVFPRGGESNYTLVVIDGVPANAFGGDVDFGQLTTANAERIEIVRGPQSALYGSNAIGSVVRIVSRKGGPPSVQFSAEGGHYGTSRVSASTSGQQGDFEWGGFFDQLLSDGMNGDATAAGETISNDDYERRTGAASVGWHRGSAWLRGDLRQSNDERGFPGPFGTNPVGAYEGIDTVARGKNDRTLAAVSASAPLTGRLRVQGQAGYNAIDSDFVSQFGGSDSFSRRWTARGQVDTSLGRGFDLSAGIEFQRERAGSTFITGAAFQEIPIKRWTAGYFGEARWNGQDRLFVNAGLRVEDIRRERIEESTTEFSPRPVLPADTVVSVNPRLAVAWLARTETGTYTKLRGAAGTGIRPPDSFELAFTDNPGLKPERSASVEGGIDQAFAGGRGLLEATAFFTNYDDLIVAVGSFSGSSRYKTDNISNARARGAEIAVGLRGRIAGRRPIDLSGRVGYTYLDTEVLAVDQNESAPPPFSVGQDLLRRPAHQFFADASLATGPLTVFLRAGGRSKVLDVEPSFGTFGGLFDAAGYQVWNTGAAWRIAGFVEVFGRVENLFDRSYEEALGFPALGRRATAGLRIAAGH